ncbi:MAG: cell division protein FtsL [Candidatus Hydrogenedentota bacterium]
MSSRTDIFKPERILNLETLTHNQRTQIRFLVKYIRILAAIAIVLFTIVFIKNYTLKVRFKKGQLELKRDELLEENRKLMIKYSAVTDPVRIEKIAREKLGMVLPDRKNIHLMQIYEDISEVPEKLAKK